MNSRTESWVHYFYSIWHHHPPIIEQVLCRLLLSVSPLQWRLLLLIAIWSLLNRLLLCPTMAQAAVPSWFLLRFEHRHIQPIHTRHRLIRSQFPHLPQTAIGQVPDQPLLFLLTRLKVPAPAVPRQFFKPCQRSLRMHAIAIASVRHRTAVLLVSVIVEYPKQEVARFAFRRNRIFVWTMRRHELPNSKYSN